MASDIGDERRGPDEPDEVDREPTWMGRSYRLSGRPDLPRPPDEVDREPYWKGRSYRLYGRPDLPRPPGHEPGAVVPAGDLGSGEQRDVREGEHVAQRPAERDSGSSIRDVYPQPALPSDSGRLLRSIRSNGAWERIQYRSLSRSSERWLPDIATGVGLQDAIEALSRALEQAWLNDQQQGSHFALGPAEAKVHIIPSRQASSEVEWRVLQVDSHASAQAGLTHTLTMRFLLQPARGKSKEDSEGQAVSREPFAEDP